MRGELEVMPDAGALADAVAAHFVAAADQAIRARGAFVVALSGGSTPRATYGRLAREPLVSRVNWSCVQVVWGDERCVPPDRAESNFGMAREALLDHVPIPAANLHRIRGEDDPTAGAARYETTLRALLRTPTGPPRTAPGTSIDLVFLGLGADGHTASLFPRSTALQEQQRWATPAHALKPPVWRVTLTPIVINAAREVLFLVSGPSKADIVRQVLEGPSRPQEFPAQAIAPIDGRVRWCLDAAAAVMLGSRPPEVARPP